MDFVAEDRPADVSLGLRVENRELNTSFAWLWMGLECGVWTRMFDGVLKFLCERGG